MSARNQAAKRLKSDFDEMMSAMLTSADGISAFPCSEDDYTHWKGTIEGPDSSYFKDMQFTLDFKFPPNYPMVPPVVKFETPIFHPNIDMSGHICVDILKDKWECTMSVRTVLLSLQLLLLYPNNASPLNNQAAQLWEDKQAFLKLAKRRYENLPLS